MGVCTARGRLALQTASLSVFIPRTLHTNTVHEKSVLCVLASISADKPALLASCYHSGLSIGIPIHVSCG